MRSVRRAEPRSGRMGGSRPASLIQSLQGAADDLIMVERQPGQAAATEPRRLRGVVTRGRRRNPVLWNQNQIDDGDRPASGIAIRPAERVQLFHPHPRSFPPATGCGIRQDQAGLLGQFAASGLIERLVHLHEAPRQRPPTFKRPVTTTNEQHTSSRAFGYEHNEVDRYHRTRMAVDVFPLVATKGHFARSHNG